MKARKKGLNSTQKKSRRKQPNKANRRRILKGQKKFCKKKHITPLNIKMNKIKSKVNNGTTEEKTIKLVKKLLGDETIDAIPGIENDANLLQDLDLLVLGSSQEEYKRYRDLLRKEYSHLDDNSYKQMRLKVLQTFLMIPTIFATQEFQNKFEETARSNIKQEIEDLKN